MAGPRNLIWNLLTGKNTVEKDLKKAQKEVAKVEKGFINVGKTAKAVSGSVTDLAKNFFNLRNAIIGAVGAFSLKRAVDEAVALENALIGLQSVAGATGNSVDEISEAAKDLAADGLIPLTEVSRSLKNLLATGLDANQSIKLFKALRDSASFNRQGQLSLADAVSRATDGFKNQLSILVDNAGITKNLSVLQKEYAASIGKTVGQLTEQEKTQANYVGILREAAIFQGDYNKLVETFQGVTNKATGTFRFLLAEIGELITKNPLVIKAIGNFTKDLQGLRDLLRQNRENITDFVFQGLIGIAQFAKPAANGLVTIAKALGGISKAIVLAGAGVQTLIGAFLELKIVQTIFNGIGIAVTTITSVIIDLLAKLTEFGLVKSTLGTLGVDVEGLNASLKETVKTLDSLRDDTSFDPILKRVEITKKAFFELADGIDELLLNFDKGVDGSTENIAKLIEELNKLREAASKAFAPRTAGSDAPPRDERGEQFPGLKAPTVSPLVEATNQLFETFSNNLGPLLTEIDEFGLGGIQDIQERQDKLVGGFDTAFGKITKGINEFVSKAGLQLAGGLASAIGQGSEGAKNIIAGVADAFFPGLGPIIQLLSLSSDQLKATIDAFFDALPALVETIISNLPVLLERVIRGFIRAIPNIVSSFIKAFIALIPEVAVSFVESLVGEAPKFIEALIKGIGDGIADIFKDTFSGGGLIGGIPIIGDVLGGVGDVFGFANGGIVPGTGNRDSVPALLTPGERVLTVDENRMFENQNAVASENNELLRNVVSLLQQPQMVNTSVEFRQEVLADILVQLDRTGSRVGVGGSRFGFTG